LGQLKKREDEPMNANDLRRAGNISMGFAMVAAVVGALSLMSVTSTAYGGSDDSGSDDRGGDSRGSDDRSSDDRGGDDNGGHTRGRGSDDVGYDDHGRRHGGHGADDLSQGGYVLPLLGDVVSDWEARGYRVLDISREDGSVVELDVINTEGQRIEMYVDVATGTILRQHLED
jgi:hypothetical protein